MEKNKNSSGSESEGNLNFSEQAKVGGLSEHVSDFLRDTNFILNETEKEAEPCVVKFNLLQASVECRKEQPFISTPNMLYLNFYSRDAHNQDNAVPKYGHIVIFSNTI